MSRANTI